jgi:hypothetical protein
MITTGFLVVFTLTSGAAGKQGFLVHPVGDGRSKFIQPVRVPAA